MYAVIKTGGKQYRVAANDKIQIEKLIGNPGDKVEFAEVLMISNDGTVDIGQPFVAGAQPPHLAAIAPFSVIADIYRKRILKRGGRSQSWGWETAYPNG